MRLGSAAASVESGPRPTSHSERRPCRLSKVQPKQSGTSVSRQWQPKLTVSGCRADAGSLCLALCVRDWSLRVDAAKQQVTHRLPDVRKGLAPYFRHYLYSVEPTVCHHLGGVLSRLSE